MQWIRAGGIRFMLGLHPAVSVAALLVIAPQFPTAPAGEFRVGWVQGNGPTGYFDDKVPGDVLAAQTAATVPLYGQPMDLLAWPEGGVDVTRSVIPPPPRRWTGSCARPGRRC